MRPHSTCVFHWAQKRRRSAPIRKGQEFALAILVIDRPTCVGCIALRALAESISRNFVQILDFLDGKCSEKAEGQEVLQEASHGLSAGGGSKH
jgi:hypothetical protein